MGRGLFFPPPLSLLDPICQYPLLEADPAPRYIKTFFLQATEQAP